MSQKDYFRIRTQIRLLGKQMAIRCEHIARLKKLKQSRSPAAVSKKLFLLISNKWKKDFPVLQARIDNLKAQIEPFSDVYENAA